MLATHDLDQAALLAERVLVLNRGRIVMDGPPEEIFSAGEELRRIGLALPAITEIMLALKQRGLPLDGAVFSIPEARRVINRWRKQAAKL